MKTTLNLLLASSALFLFSASEAGALPPRQHAASGVITEIDHDARILTLKKKNGEMVHFVWNKSTRFLQARKPICLGALKPGQPVKLYYRRELGKPVPREVNLNKTAALCCSSESMKPCHTDPVKPGSRAAEIR